MTILQSLKKLHKKMTGQETTSKTIGGILDSMQENYPGGGNGSGDSTSGSAFITTLTKHPDPNQENVFTYTSDKTFDQILEAYQAEIPCICKLPQYEGEEGTVFMDLPVVASFNDSVIAFMLTQNLFDKESYTLATVIKDGDGTEWNVYDSPIRSDIPNLNEEENSQYKVLRVNYQSERYELVPASFIIHIGAYDNTMFTQETVQAIINAYTNSIPIEAYMESIAFTNYEGTAIKYQIEKIYYSDDPNDNNPYKIVFSYYDENEITKRKYITMESPNINSAYVVTLT